MIRPSSVCLLIVVAGAAVSSLAVQDTQPASETGLARALEQCRTLITDTRAGPDVRRIGAERLLELNAAAAIDLAIDILQTNGDPLPRVAVCQAVTAIGTRDPGLLSERLVPPLLDSLGAPDATVRSTAAVALSSFPDGQVARELGELAADTEAPVLQRLAAVDALAPIVDRRQVVHQLIRLLDSESAEVRTRVLAALRPASGVDYGPDVDRWKQWWQDKAALDDRQWLADRVGLLRQRNRDLQETTSRRVAATEQRLQQLSRRLLDELEVVYRLTPPPQREDLLVRWLGDPLVEARQAAVSRIAANISDGNPPPEAVRATLRERFSDESPEVRRRVFDVIAALTDPNDAEAVCSRLEHETVPTVREGILRTMGRLQNPIAIGPLTAELGDPNATDGCLIEAAASLGRLGGGSAADPAAIAAAIEPLKQRFATTSPDALRLRASLLEAMAGIGAAEFTEEFLANLDADQPRLLLPAIAGVTTVRDGSRIDRIFALASSNDARVRCRAFEALGVLGGAPAHLEATVSRLSPATEPSEAVRQAAWGAFCSILQGRPVQVRLEWAARLKDFPEREEAYLKDLTADLAGLQPPPAELDAARRQLAELYDAQGRFAESFPLWRDLWQSYVQAGGRGRRPVLSAGHAALAAVREGRGVGPGSAG